jgi:hypothetical protein
MNISPFSATDTTDDDTSIAPASAKSKGSLRRPSDLSHSTDSTPSSTSKKGAL